MDFPVFVIALAGIVALSQGVVYTPQLASVIDIDLTPFFDSLNQYLPTFIGIFALIGGIGGAIIFSKYIIGTILDVFGGKGI